jgi:NADPH-dependent 7-cyano-7-deazaguanine reductase QueF
LWADIGIAYTRRIYASSLLELEEYILKYANVHEVYEEKEIINDIKKTIYALLKLNKGRMQIVEEISGLHGIPQQIVEEIYDELITELQELRVE